MNTTNEKVNTLPRTAAPTNPTLRAFLRAIEGYIARHMPDVPAHIIRCAVVTCGHRWYDRPVSTWDGAISSKVRTARSIALFDTREVADAWRTYVERGPRSDKLTHHGERFSRRGGRRYVGRALRTIDRRHPYIRTPLYRETYAARGTPFIVHVPGYIAGLHEALRTYPLIPVRGLAYAGLFGSPIVNEKFARPRVMADFAALAGMRAEDYGNRFIERHLLPESATVEQHRANATAVEAALVAASREVL